MTPDRNGENGYLSLVRQVLSSGKLSENRTGIKTLAIFGDHLRFCLRKNKLAMLTTKFISFSTVLKELLWFMRGDTNQQILAKQNVNIWRDNSTRAFLDSRGLYHYRELETLGPIYGFQWRHFGADYIDCHTNYTGVGYDQLQTCIDQIKNDPTSRRIILSAWNPKDLDKMALPPCHMMVQFNVDQQQNELSAHMYQRSADLMLGVPYNLLSYSLLLHILAKKCSLLPGELVCSFGNIHIYENHLNSTYLQLKNQPLSPPVLEMCFDKDITIEDLELAHFKVKDYKHCGKINFKMAV